MSNNLYTYLDEMFDEMVNIRRYLHENPELSFEEVHTPRYIASFHEELGHHVRTKVGGNGVVATMQGKKPGPTVALRADFDALAIQEANDVSYKSKVNGVMHACGHDGHTASLLGLAKALNRMKTELKGTVVFIHQHAEEKTPGGAKAMIEDGCLEGVDVIFGSHLKSDYPLGVIRYRSGPFMAAADSFQITINGKGGHGARPHEAKDSVLIGSEVVSNLQKIVSRGMNPVETAVLSVGSFEAKNPFNVIADSAMLSGTVRTFDAKVRDFIEQEMERIIKGTCLAADVDYHFEYNRGYPPVVNHENETQLVADIAPSVPGVEKVVEADPMMAGEDYAYYLQHAKGTYINTGAQNPEWEIDRPHHHPHFDIDERSLLIAAKVLGKSTLEYMEQNAD